MQMTLTARRIPFIGVLLAAATLVGLDTGVARAAVPAYDHVVIVVEENRNDSEITPSAAPFIDRLRRDGASLTEMYGIVHPSQGNYFAMFHGWVAGLFDECPVMGAPFDRPNLASKLIAKGKSFGAYMQGYPGRPSTCSSGDYVQRHAPWLNFTNIPTSAFMTDTQFPSDFSELPTVSYLIPDNRHNMHSASVAQGDAYLRNKLSDYAAWAKSNNSLLIVTWDESQVFNPINNIETILYGAHVKPGRYGNLFQKVNHYNMLRTLEDMYGLPHDGGTHFAAPITEPFAS